MQTQILHFFQSIASEPLDLVAEAVTMLGEEGVYFLVIAAFYWAISKKKGFLMAALLLLSLFTNTVLKMIFHTPRPFEVLELKGKRLETATGYAFPSGHTQGATTFYSSLIILFASRVFRFLCVIAILLVGISRLYLGVHWPVDVLGGWVLGGLIAWSAAHVIERTWDERERLNRILMIALLLISLLTVAMVFLEELHFQGSVKVNDYFKSAGILLGCFTASILEYRILNFDAVSGTVKVKILRVILGIIGLLIWQNGLKILFPDLYWAHLIRYAVMGFWICFAYPYVGLKAGFFQKIKE